MYNLLIVDDEKSIVESIANDLPWEELNISRVFTACSGKQALEIIEQKRIDILLSDISMPELDGIHLAEYVHSRFQHTKIIFMTGYDRFEYARQAIRHGVFAYLLKPVTNEEMLDTVRHALEALQAELEKNASYSKIEKQFMEALPLLQNRFLHEWIVQGRYNAPGAAAAQFDKLHIGFSYDSHCILMLLKVDELGAEDTLDERKGLALQNMISDILLQNQEHVIFEITHSAYGVIVPISGAMEGLAPLQRVQALWSIFLSSAQYAVGHPVSLFLIDHTVPVADLSGCYKRLHAEMDKHLPVHAGMLNLLQPSDAAGRYDAAALLNYHPSYYDLTNALDPQSVARLETVFSELMQREECTRGQLLELYFLISSSLLSLTKNRGFSLSECFGRDESYFFSFERFSSVESLMKWSIKATNRFISYAKNNAAERIDSVVDNTMRQIRKEIRKNISVADLAREQFISPSHLARVFKQTTGMTVQDYIIHEKIQAAKHMLKLPGTKVYEVVEALGYTSISHFDRLFKREVGISPKEYQSKL